MPRQHMPVSERSRQQRHPNPLVCFLYSLNKMNKNGPV